MNRHLLPRVLPIFIALVPAHVLASAAFASADGVIAYPRPSIYQPSATFALRAGDLDIPVIAYSKQYDYTVFALSVGSCRLQLVRLDGKPIEKASISPMKLGIAWHKSGSMLSFTVGKPVYLIVQVDNLRKLVIAIDPPETDRPAPRGSGIYNVTAPPYLADATGRASCTVAIQKAIDDAGKDPQLHGIVYFPTGVYGATNIRLVSNVSLYLEPGAVLRCAGERDQFAVLFRKDSQNRKGTWFIYTGDGAANVRIFGRGTIDGNGKQFIKTLNFLNHLVVPLNCSNFTMDGPVLRESGLWGTVIANSNHVTLRNCKHFNMLDQGEDDCIDVCDSQDVNIDRSIAISLDDPYSCKTWTDGTDITSHWSGPAQPNRHIVFDDCFAWTRCFAFKIGAGVFQPQDDITFRNGVVYDAAHGIGISDSYGSADLRRVLFDSIDIERTSCNNLGRSWARFVIDRRKDPTEGGNVQDIVLHNIRVRDAGTMPVPVEGLAANRMIRRLTFSEIYMPGRSKPASTLEEIGVTATQFADGISVKP